jgi:acetolactate decarboxylase
VPEVRLDLPPAVLDVLRARSDRTGESIDRIAARALADALQVGHSTVFQVSTASALVAGVADGAVTVEDLMRHGDFGLGTFAGWDGEMVVVDGTAYRVNPAGVSVAGNDAEVPFALVTHFVPERELSLTAVDSAEDLHRRLDGMRHTDNDLFAVRVEGRFGRLTTRAVCASTSTTPLDVAVQTQAEFDLTDVDAVLVGYWTPPHLQSIGISGWHLHALTDDRAHGGHVFDCEGASLAVGVQHLADFRLAIPETAAFRHAHLATDVHEAIDAAETKPTP